VSAGSWRVSRSVRRAKRRRSNRRGECLAQPELWDEEDSSKNTFHRRPEWAVEAMVSSVSLLHSPCECGGQAALILRSIDSGMPSKLDPEIGRH